jgi:redox-regulated HSP33 family molecular chaperone
MLARISWGSSRRVQGPGRALRCSWPRFSSSANVVSHDVMLAAMTGDQDVTVKVVSMARCVDQALEHRRLETSPAAARALAEVMMSSVLLGTNLTDNETLQINIVGSEGLKHAIAICDHNLNARCKIANYSYNPAGDDSGSDALSLFGGEAQIQVIRTHPSYKEPSTGVIQMQSGHIAFNMGVYMQGSEQRTAAFITKVIDVKFFFIILLLLL